MYKSTISVDYDKDLEKLFSIEEKNLGRSSYKITKKTNKLTFDITADDSVALKTVLNTIVKVIIVWEKVKNGCTGKN